MADYIAGKQGGDVLPIVLITTTAGTGSEANNYAVFTNPETKVKKSLKSPKIYARVSIIDPELMLTVPKKVTASTGIDVMDRVGLPKKISAFGITEKDIDTLAEHAYTKFSSEFIKREGK